MSLLLMLHNRNIINPSEWNETAVLWLDATDSAYKTVVSGGISSWRNKLGAEEWTQGTAGLRPTDNGALTGQYQTMVFDGGDVLGSAAPLTLGGDFSIFFVINTPVSGAINILVGSAAANKLGMASNAPAALLGGTPLISVPTLPAGRSVLAYARDGSNNTTIYINGTQTASGNAGTATLTLTRIGAVDATPTEGFIGGLVEILAFSADLTAANMIALSKQFMGKYNI